MQLRRDLSLPPDRRRRRRPLDPRRLHGRPLWLIEEGDGGWRRPGRAARRDGDPLQRRRAGLPLDVDPLPRRAARRRSSATALEAIFTGRLGGDARKHFPWAWKASELLAVRPVEIEVDHTRRRQWLRIRDHVSVQIRDRYPGAETVTCVIPGHDRDGEELVADELVVEDGAAGIQLPRRLRLRRDVRLQRLG